MTQFTTRLWVCRYEIDAQIRRVNEHDVVLKAEGITDLGSLCQHVSASDPTSRAQFIRGDEGVNCQAATRTNAKLGMNRSKRSLLQLLLICGGLFMLTALFGVLISSAL